MDWTHHRGGRPAIDRSVEITRPIIRFSNEGDENVVSWEEWMSIFDRDQWAFIYQDRKSGGELSLRWKVIPRFPPDDQPSG